MKEQKQPIHEKVYLYSLWSGMLKVYEGDIYSSPWAGQGSFLSDGKRKGCSLEPKKVHNAMVWIPERDDQLARVILIQYEEMEIKKLQDKIENHLNRINILKDV